MGNGQKLTEDQTIVSYWGKNKMTEVPNHSILFGKKSLPFDSESLEHKVPSQTPLEKEVSPGEDGSRGHGTPTPLPPASRKESRRGLPVYRVDGGRL